MLLKLEKLTQAVCTDKIFSIITRNEVFVIFRQL